MTAVFNVIFDCYLVIIYNIYCLYWSRMQTWRNCAWRSYI